MFHTFIKINSLAFIASILIACGGGSENNDSTQSKSEDNTSPVVVRNIMIEPGPICEFGGIEVTSGTDSNSDGVLTGSEIIETQVVCHGNNGYDSLVRIDGEPAGTNCANGGQAINSGRDLNRNEILDNDEITSTSYVCNGANGQDGTPGTGTVSCTITDGTNGSQILQCADGTSIAIYDGITYIPTTITPITGGLQIADSWESSGGPNVNSFRNRHYTFEVLSDGSVDITMTTNANGRMYLLNNLGIEVASTVNPYFNPALTAGTYTLVAATNTLGESGNYTIDMVGDVTNIQRIASQRAVIDGNWVSAGGSNSESYRNKHYTFDVAIEHYIDIEVTTPAQESVYLLDEIGNLVTYSVNGRIAQLIQPGSYRLVAAASTNSTASFQMSVDGHFSNLNTIASDLIQFSGAWNQAGGANVGSYRNIHYTFDVREDSYLDIITSSILQESIYLIDPSRGVTYQSNGNYSGSVVAGTYELVVAGSQLQTAGFDVSIFGQVQNLQAITSQTLSTNGAWASSAGRDPVSLNNPRYQVTVNQDHVIDVVVTSAVNAYLYLLDSFGNVVQETFSDRLLADVTATEGTYYVVVATQTAGETGNFNLNVNGQVSNLVLAP